MKIRIVIIVIALATSFCATQSKTEKVLTDSVIVVNDSTLIEESENLFKLENYLVQGKVGGADVQTISTSSVLVVNPTDEQIAEMEKEYGEDFPTIADDASFYQSNAMSVIDSLGINNVTAEKPFALLVGKTSPWTLNLRKKGAPGWMIILFNENKTPQIVPAIDVNREMLNDFFELK